MCMSNLRVRIATERRAQNVYIPHAPHYLLQHRAVVGVHVEGQEPRSFPAAMRRGDDPHVSTCQMQAEVALRLDTFVRRHYLSNVHDFSHLSFMRFMAGLDERSYGEASARHTVYTGHAVDKVLLETTPYRPYILLKGGLQGRKVLGLIGFTETQSLCVLADRSRPLVIAPNGILMKMCAADTLMAVDGISK